MKKMFIGLIVCGLAITVFAQGTFVWLAPAGAMVSETNTTAYSLFGGSGSPAGTQSIGLTGSYQGGMGVIYYALLTSSGLSTAPTSLSQFYGTLSTAWLDTGLMMTNSLNNNGRMTPLANQLSTGAMANNWAVGSTQNAMMVGWSANLGTTWSAVLNNIQFGNIPFPAWLGISTSIAVGLTPSNGNIGLGIFGSGSSQQIDGSLATGSPIILQQIVIIPEPTSMNLAGLGGLTLLVLCRKKLRAKALLSYNKKARKVFTLRAFEF